MRPAGKLVAWNENIKESQKVPDFEAIIKKMTKFYKKVEESRFLSVTNLLFHPLHRKKVVPMGR